MLINVDDILKIVKLVLLSGYIKGVKPLSLFLISEYGLGKTEIITNYKDKRILFATDISYIGLLSELKENKNVTHLVIPDFLKITMKKRSTSDNLISLLNAGTEEGIGMIHLGNFKEDFKNRNIGIVVATTKDSYNQRKKYWKGIGFLSRMIICSYSYSKDTTDKIITFINSEEYLNNNKKSRLDCLRKQEIKSTEQLNKQLNDIADKKFRTLKQLQTLAKCNALVRNDNKVTIEDINEIKRLSKYLNLGYNKL